MKRFYFIAILISFIFFQIEAQINNTFIIRANVIDGWTGEAVDGVKAFYFLIITQIQSILP